MRDDMSEVVIERPRGGSSSCYHEVRPRPNKTDLEALDDLPKNEGYRRPHVERKHFSDLLGPLERFLISNVGRVWNDVYSEICEQISPDSTVQIHILGHVEDFVCKNVFMAEDGDLRYVTDRGWISHVGYGDMYVDPETGILSRMPDRTNYWRAYKRNPEYQEAVKKMYRMFGHGWPTRYSSSRDTVEEARHHHYIGFEKELHQIEGIWYWAVFKDVPPPFTDHWFHQGEKHEKLVRRSGTDFLTGKNVFEGRYRSHKLQASRRDLRRYGLKNDTDDA
jgi:hypothetical protein